MNHIFDRQPDLPQQPMPSEIEQAVFGKSVAPVIVEARPQNPWIKPTGTEELDFDAEEKEMYRALEPIQKLFDPNSIAAVAPAEVKGRFPIRFSKQTTAPDPTTPPPVKPPQQKLTYKKFIGADGTQWMKGSGPDGEWVSMRLVLDAGDE